MAWMKIESSVARNRKFVKAGPAPSWLWLCGLAYCQEGLTDGFIPAEALDFLGVKNAGQLASHLVKAGLWHQEEGGWRVNDYLEHNRSAAEVAEIKERRARGGHVGGRPKKNLPENLPVSEKVSGKETLPKTFPVSVSVAASESVAAADLSVAFVSFQKAYPASRVKGGYLVQSAFFDQVAKAGGAQVLLDALDNHKASEQWADPKLIPGMDTWLREERWRQRLEPKGSAANGKPLPAWAQKARGAQA